MILKVDDKNSFAQPKSNSLKDDSLFSNKAFAELISETIEELSPMSFSNKIFELHNQIARPLLDQVEEEKDSEVISRIGRLKKKRN